MIWRNYVTVTVTLCIGIFWPRVNMVHVDAVYEALDS